MTSKPKSDPEQIMQPGIVVIAEHANGRIKPVVYEVISFARKLQRKTGGDSIKILLLTDSTENPSPKLAQRSGLEVIAVQIPEVDGYSGEVYLQALTEVLSEMQPGFVCIAHTPQGLDYAPALAVKLNAACLGGITDCFESDGQISFDRPIYGGKINARLKPAGPATVITVQPGCFRAKKNSAGTAGKVTVISTSAKSRRSRSLGIRVANSDAAGIEEASVIVAAGRGIGERENLDLLDRLAALFPGSAVAGSRIVCDTGWMEYQRQVGVTGKTVSPKLYIACGISGAVQHVTGMQGSEFIVAINKDPSAAIFRTSDVCIVEDLTLFIPEFLRICRESKSSL